MGLNTTTNLPDWLTKEKINELKENVKKYIPYPEDEVIDIPFDSYDLDFDRMSAYLSMETLKTYGII